MSCCNPQFLVGQGKKCMNSTLPVQLSFAELLLLIFGILKLWNISIYAYHAIWFLQIFLLAPMFGVFVRALEQTLFWALIQGFIMLQELTVSAEDLIESLAFGLAWLTWGGSTKEKVGCLALLRWMNKHICWRCFPSLGIHDIELSSGNKCPNSTNTSGDPNTVRRRCTCVSQIYSEVLCLYDFSDLWGKNTFSRGNHGIEIGSSPFPHRNSW